MTIMGYWICQVQNCLRKNVGEYGLLEMLGTKLFEEECHEYGLSISRDVYRKARDCLQLKKEQMGKGKLTTENRRQKEKTMSNYLPGCWADDVGYREEEQGHQAAH